MKLEKEEVIEKLKERGYDAYADGQGIIFIKCSVEESKDPKYFNEVRSALHELGWRRSWGYGVRKRIGFDVTDER